MQPSNPDTVYRPSPYVHGPRHGYLTKYVPGVNPAVLSRSVELVMGQLDPPLSRSLPIVRPLDTTVPNTYAPHVDVTRARVAFGRWALPRLRRHLTSPDSLVVRQAVTSLVDILYDPERISEALEADVPRTVLELLTSGDAYKRERALAVLVRLAGFMEGREAILALGKFLPLLRRRLQDNTASVRLRAAELLERLALYSPCPPQLDEAQLAPLLLQLLVKERENVVINLMLQALYCLLELESTRNQAVADGGMRILENHARRFTVPGRTAAALACISRLVTTDEGRAAARKANIMALASKALQSKEAEVRARAASVLMNVTLEDDGRTEALSAKLIEPLRAAARDPESRELRLCALQTLANLSEMPRGRGEMRKQLMGQQEMPASDADDVAKRVIDSMLSVVNWDP